RPDSLIVCKDCNILHVLTVNLNIVMKGNTILIAFLICLGLRGNAQNLVPNPGFESFNNCPGNWAGIQYDPNYNNFPTVRTWVSPLEHTTPDYFNACATVASKVNIPFTFMGYHDAHMGDACAGIIAY